MVTWPHHCGPVVIQNIMAGRSCWSKAAHFMVGEEGAEGRERERERERERAHERA
jgi:hypothetical protein